MTVDLERVELSDVTRHFGRRRAVTRISFNARRGDVLGLLGPNGAGKSTLIGMLATLVRPSSGTILYDGQSAWEGGVGLRARIGLLAHELHLYTDLSARENLDFFAKLHGLDTSTVVPNALETAGLADRADDAVGGFSRGMRQRLALERALLHQPRLALFDEPFTGLDDRSVTLVVDRLRGLATSGAIVIVATHDLDLAEGLLTRVAVVRDGKLLCDEPASGGLKSRYRGLMGHS